MIDGDNGGDSDAPLLQVDKLTLRFRGLTAVDGVDLNVPAGSIFAVIGPNGAGKTSLFNAITGINEPTSGTVTFEGSDLRRRLTRAHLLRWGAVGLVMGVFLTLLTSDVNVMWAAVVKQNYQTAAEQQRFPVAQSLIALRDYLAAKPRIEQRMGRYYVTTHDGRTPFGAVRTMDEARARQAQLAGDPDGGAAGARRTRFFAFLFGTLLGVAGAYAVWRQTRRTPSSVAARGIARTFQNIRLFQEMSVLENVLVGMDRHLRARGPGAWRRQLRGAAPLLGLVAVLLLLVLALRWNFGGPTLWGLLLATFVVGTIAYLITIARLGAFSRSTIQSEAAARGEAGKLLSFVGLAGRQNERAKNLAYGDQRRLEIARALATRARLLLLDEPAAGMNPAETVSLMQLIRDIRARGVTVLLIEHHMRVVMGISDRIAVLEYGQKIAEGTPEEIRGDPRVIEAYLGKEELG